MLVKDTELYKNGIKLVEAMKTRSLIKVDINKKSFLERIFNI